MTRRARIVAALVVVLALLVSIVVAIKAKRREAVDTGGIEETRKAIEQAGSGLTMYALKGSSDYEVWRAEPKGDPVDVSPDSWTVFVYLCGSDLESEKGAASRDLSEMLEANLTDEVTVVVETGGAKQWESKDVDASHIERFVVRDHALELEESLDVQDMGEDETLADFLRWGVANHPADHMALILWDHGGGSGKGLCMDELYDFDTLELRELDRALNAAFLTMDRKFEFVGFDACLMGSIECANVVATYANYMVASEEWEPGTGWPYTDLLNYLSAHRASTGGEVGRAVCDAFLPSGERAERLASVTLAVYDLSHMDELLQRFNAFSRSLYAVTEDERVFTDVVRTIADVENFGGNNREEGYSNMVDLGCAAWALSPYVEGADDLLAALSDVVCYHVSGSTHQDAKGMSFFYPLRVGRRRQLQLFQSVCVNPSYLAFVNRIVRSIDENPDDLGKALSSYSDDSLYVDGEWVWLTDEHEATEEDDTLWSDISEIADSSYYGSSHITFSSAPTVSADGRVTFVLDEQGLGYAKRAGSMYFEYIDEDMLYLGGLLDVRVDWSTGVGTGTVDGMWLSLPDGQNLCITPVDDGDGYVTYSSSIFLNGRETNLRIRRYDDGHCVCDGTWSGIDDEGISDRGVTTLADGDVIEPLYIAINTETRERSAYLGEPFVVSGELEISLGPLDPDEYGFGLFIEDVFGNSWVSGIYDFTMDGTPVFAGQASLVSEGP